MAKDKELVIKLRAEVSAANKALKEAKDRVKELEVAQSNLDKRTKGGRAIVEQYRSSLRQLEVQEKKLIQSKTKLTIAQRRANAEAKSLNTSMVGVSNSSGAATSAVLEMGRVVQDSNYGIRGMANNITQLASQLAFTAKKSKGFIGFVKELKGALLGPAGLILLISAVVSVLEKMEMKSKDTGEAQDEMADSIKRANQKLKEQKELIESILATISPKRLLGVADGIAEAIQSSILNTGEAVKLLIRQFPEFKNAYDKLSESQKGDSKNVIALAKGYEELLDKRNKYKKLAIELSEAEKNLKKAEKSRNDSAIFSAEQTLGAARRNFEFVAKRLLVLESYFERINKKSSKGKKSKDLEPWVIESGLALTPEQGAILSEMDTEILKKLNNSRKAIYDEEKVDMSKRNESLLELQIKHREALLADMQEGSMEYHEMEREISSIRIDLMNQELETEMLIIEQKKNAQMEYINWTKGLSGIFRNIGKQNEAMAVAGLVLEKGAAAAKVVIDANASIASMTANKNAANLAAVKKYASVPFGWKLSTAEIIKNEALHKKGVAETKVSAGISIANILASTIQSKGNVSGGGSSGSSSGQGGREFDFNLVGSTGNNQLAQAVGGQFKDQTVRAYVVGSDITNRQQLDNKIKTTATFGD